MSALLHIPDPVGPTVTPPSMPIFQDPVSRALVQRAEAIAQGDAHVLLLGRPGSGKRLMARHIHGLSRRAASTFLAVHCGAYSEDKLLQDMCGHERGAVKGGFAARAGWFEMAQQGTLFLGEVASLSLALQDVLLDILRDGQVSRLGSARHLPVDVRIVACSSVDLDEAVADGRFRPGLRALFGDDALHLPAQIERPADILPLARHVLAQWAQRMSYPPTQLDDAAQACLQAYAWPGNILELENVIHHAMRASGGGVITLMHLPPSVREAQPPNGNEAGHDALLRQLDEVLSRLCEPRAGTLFEDVEHALVRAAYRHAGHNQIQAARLLGISRNVLRGRLIDYGEIDALK